MMKILPCREGDCVAVQIGEGQEAVGIVARLSEDGLMLCYFFLPSTTSDMSADSYSHLSPKSASLVCICNGLGFENSEWRVVHKLSNWNRDDWPIPSFGEIDLGFKGVTWLVRVDDITLRFGQRIKVSPDDIKGLPDAAYYGYKSVEATLANLAKVKSYPAQYTLKEEPYEPNDRIQPSARTKLTMNRMQRSLVALLTDLDAIGQEHKEIFDTDVREQMHDALYQSFIDPSPGYKLPQKFGMFSVEGNRRVRSALKSFIDAADTKVVAYQLKTVKERLDAFQDISIHSASGSTYDEYFGHRD